MSLKMNIYYSVFAIKFIMGNNYCSFLFAASNPSRKEPFHKRKNSLTREQILYFTVGSPIDKGSKTEKTTELFPLKMYPLTFIALISLLQDIDKWTDIDKIWKHEIPTV